MTFRHRVHGFFAVLTSAALLVQLLAPSSFIFAEELQPTEEPTPTPTEEVLPAPEEPTPTPAINPEPTETPTPTETLQPAPTPEPSAVPEPQEEEPPHETGPPAQTSPPAVVLGEVYRYGDSGVSVVFTRLPEVPGTLTIKKVKLTPEQVEELGALSDAAYDVTSSMENGTFTYDLTLPLPDAAKGKDVEVKADGQIVNEPKEVKSETITITGLHHFTVFVIADPSTSGVGGSGDVTWSNTSNIYSSDNSRATVSLVSGETSKNLKATGFGLSIPTGAVIEGVEVLIEKRVDVSRTNASKDNRVKLVVGGSATGDNKALSEYFNNTTDDVTIYGSPTDLWGLSLTPEQVNADDFGVAYSAARHPSGSSAQKVRVDQIQVKVYYNTSPTISLLSPNGGELFAGNSSQTISWNAADVDAGDAVTITLEYTVNDGTTYEPVAAGLANTGIYSWPVPMIDSTTVKLRATASDGTVPSSDSSDADFTIDATLPTLFDLTFTSDNANAAYAKEGDTVTLHFFSDEPIQPPTILIAGQVVAATNNLPDNGNEWTAIYTITAGDAEGNIPFSINYVDAVGNSGNEVTSETSLQNVLYDRTNPTDSGIPTADVGSPTNQTTVSWIWDPATDITSGLKQYLWNFWQNLNPIDSGTTNDAQLIFDLSFFGDGDFYLDVQAEDNAGNVSNTINSDTTTVDTTPPTVTAAETMDSDANGYLDGIQLTFSENINDDMLDSGNPDGWDVADPTAGEAISTGDNDYDNILLLSFGEGPTPDTANTPAVTYAPSGGPISTHDLAGNELEEYEGATDDKAPPVLLSAVTQDTDINGQIDAVELTFSEDIDDTQLNPGDDGWNVGGYNGESIGTGATDFDNILLLAFDESGILDTGVTPSVSYTEGGGDGSTHDSAGNELAAVDLTSIDGAAPRIPEAEPPGSDYTNDQLVSLTSSDESGPIPDIYYTLDGSEPNAEDGTLYGEPILIDKDTTLKAIAYDSAGNASDVLTEIYGIAPVISGEASSRGGDTSFIVTWTTDDLSTSRVVYDTVSHPTPGAGENYGYANSTVEDSTLVTSHAVSVTGLNTNVTYYYRTVSHGSPETVGDEKSYSTHYIFGVGSGDGKSDGRSDGGSSGGGGAPAGGGGAVLGATTQTGAFLASYIPDVLGVQTPEETTPSATRTPTIIEEPILGTSTSALPWWPFILAGFGLLVFAWWYRVKMR